MLCWLMYWRMLLIYTMQLPISGLWVHDVSNAAINFPVSKLSKGIV